jgi:predicted house-cleaning noncanonical NTP pyrophosphatase (MazG superfamily)
MTHEPIRVIHFSLHITWQGTQAELDAMLAEGWPMGSASEIIAACNRDAAEAEAYAAKLEAKLTEELRYWQADSAAAWDKCEEYRLKLAKVKTSFRRNMMQAYPNYTHERFDKNFDEMLKGDKT